MKTAIIINGFVRTWERTVDSFLKTFSHLSPDVFVSTYDRQYGYHPHINKTFNITEDYLLDQHQIVELFKPVNPRFITIESCEHVDLEIAAENNRLHPQMQNLFNCFGQSRKLKFIANQLREYENQSNFKYDVVIKTRSDLLYTDNFKLELGDKDVMIDSGNVFPNDCFFALDREEFYYIIDFLFEEFYRCSNPSSANNPPHGLLYNAFQSRGLNIKQSKIIHSVLRATGEQFY